MRLATLLLAALFVLPAPAQEFEPAYTMEEVLERQRRVPRDDHWWAVTGDQMGWMHKNTQQMFPTVPVYRAGPVRELESAPMAAIADFAVETPEGTMRFEEFLADDQSTALGVVILHRGKVVFESYPRMRDYEKVTYWSVAKPMAGTIVYLLEARGEVDTQAPIETYIPRLADSAFAGITVRNFLEHSSGVDCSENYEDPESCYYQYSMAIGDNHRDASAADDPYEYLATAEIGRIFEPGARFDYSGVNNFIVAWLIQEVTGYPLQDLVTREFWSRIGAENDAAYIAYRYGIALSHGGFIARMRDLGRFGLLFTPSYRVVSDHEVIPGDFFDVVFNDHSGNPAWESADGAFSHIAYQWSVEPERGIISHGGWGGQGLIIDTRQDVVAVFTSFVKDDYSEVNLEQVVTELLAAVFPGLPEKTD
ncbi:MAG: serine hydrolase domain-containing protein [Woeseiaceae bacterium]|nr:serine hydrolase domain-containing protein [Woeseiaceae bacterium]